MAAFDALIEAQLAGAVIRYADLNRFDFKSGERRLHAGFGNFVDGNGETWEGIGDMGQVGPVTAGPGQSIEEMTYSLFGSAAMLEKIEQDAAETVGREALRYLQFCDIRRFDERGNWVDWQPLDKPIQIFWGLMGGPIIDRPVQQVGATSSSIRAINIKATNIFVNRRKPAYGFYSNRDQLARSGGTDNMFINASRMASVSVRWPYGLT